MSRAKEWFIHSDGWFTYFRCPYCDKRTLCPAENCPHCDKEVNCKNVRQYIVPTENSDRDHPNNL